MKLPKFKRALLKVLRVRLQEHRRFIQVLIGPRQVGKTTMVRQFLADSGLPHHYASADEPSLRDRAWIETQWEIGRLKAKDSGRRGAVFVLDEAHKAVH
jgi:uncharacterized protein